jgi:hypothetical protein
MDAAGVVRRLDDQTWLQRRPRLHEPGVPR